MACTAVSTKSEPRDQHAGLRRQLFRSDGAVGPHTLSEIGALSREPRELVSPAHNMRASRCQRTNLDRCQTCRRLLVLHFQPQNCELQNSNPSVLSTPKTSRKLQPGHLRGGAKSSRASQNGDGGMNGRRVFLQR